MTQELVIFTWQVLTNGKLQVGDVTLKQGDTQHSDHTGLTYDQAERVMHLLNAVSNLDTLRDYVLELEADG